MPLSKALYHTCFICGQRCKWWSRRPKLTSSVISDVKPIIYIYIYHRGIWPIVRKTTCRGVMYSGSLQLIPSVRLPEYCLNCELVFFLRFFSMYTSIWDWIWWYWFQVAFQVFCIAILVTFQSTCRRITLKPSSDFLYISNSGITSVLLNNADFYTQHSHILCLYSTGDYGKLGHGNSSTQKYPQQVRGALSAKVVKCVSAGYRHSAAVTEEGELYTWGEGDYGRLGMLSCYQICWVDGL